MALNGESKKSLKNTLKQNVKEISNEREAKWGVCSDVVTPTL